METGLLAGGTGFRRRPGTRVKLAILVIVVTIVSVFLYLQFGNPYGNPGLVIDWRLKLIFSDYRPPGRNYTLPSGIGTPDGIWSLNRTLEVLGPPGYSPLSTRDTSSTIWIQSNEATIFTFGDFFNVWGQTFNETCISNPTIQANTYCAAPAEAIVYDANNNSQYDPAADTLMPVPTQEQIHVPPSGATLSFDPRIKFYDQKGDGVFHLNETVIYDPDNDGAYDPGVDLIINGTATPPPMQPLRTDLRIKFFDYNGNGYWDRSVPPPTLYDAGLDKMRCLNRAIGLSNGKTWIIYLWSPYAANDVAGSCLPPGS